MYDPNKIEKTVFLTLTPEFRGTYLFKLILANATSRRPKSPEGLIVKLNLRLDRKLFTEPELTVDVVDTRVAAEAEADAVV